MPKINLTDLSNLQNETTATAAINNNNNIIEAAIENSISRDGSQPNQMNSVLDMNSNRIVNLPDAVSEQEPVSYSQFLEGITSVDNGAVIDGAFVTIEHDPSMLNERVIEAGPNISIVDGGPKGSLSIGVSSQELNALAGTGSAEDKLPYYNNTGSASLADFTSFGRDLVASEDASEARVTLEFPPARTIQGTPNEIDVVNGDGISGDPVISLSDSLDFSGKTVGSGTFSSPTINTPTGIVKGDVGLGNVDNTSDANKPISTATQTALDNKVTGPASSVNGRVVTFNGTTGKLVQDGGKTLPSGDVVGTTDTQTLTNKTISGIDNTITNIPNASVTGLGSLALKSAVAVPGDLSTTGTPDGTKFLRDDGSWQTMSAGGSLSMEFNTISDLENDTDLDYTTGTVVSVGDTVRAAGLRYVVVGSSDPDYTLATSGGVRLLLQPTDEGFWNIWGFGAYPGASNLVTKINNALVFVQNSGGGTITFPTGVYALDGTINVERGIGSDGYVDLIIRGAGRGATVLDFDGTTTTEDGIAVSGWSGRFVIRDMTILNAARHGINLTDNTNPIGSEYLSRFSVEDVVIENCGSDGLRCTSSYMFSLTGVESRNNIDNGFTFRGFHTSINANRCWAGGDASSPNGGNGNIGWDLTGVTYSTFTNCAADWNETAGWRLRHSAGCVFNGCGAESNGMEGFLCVSSSDGATEVPDFTRGINSVSFINCHAANNSKDGVNAHANFLGVYAANSYPATVVTVGCQDVNYDNPGGDSVGLNSADGTPIYLHETAPRMQGTYVKNGSVYIQDTAMAGKSIIVRRNTDQTMSGPDTEAYVTFNEVMANSLGASLSGNVVIVPKGVSRVRVTAGVMIGPLANYLQLQVHRDGSAPIGAPLSKYPGQTYTPVLYTTAVMDVDQSGLTEFSLALAHGQSPDAVVRGGDATFMCVEALG